MQIDPREAVRTEVTNMDMIVSFPSCRQGCRPVTDLHLIETCDRQIRLNSVTERWCEMKAVLEQNTSLFEYNCFFWSDYVPYT